jgi:signal transduction histidine kinase/ActR/RegA family two-component response regulator
MSLLGLFNRIGARMSPTPIVAMSLAAALVLAGVGLGLYNEHLGVVERERQGATQARILAASVAASLAFDDKSTTREYVNALRLNPDVQAAGAYGKNGLLEAGYAVLGPPPPREVTLAPPRLKDGALIVTAPVRQEGTTLGLVYVRVAVEPWPRRAARYLGIGLLVLMASILVAVLGASQASLREAHRKLMEEVAERQKAEDALRQSQKMEAMGQLTGGVAHDFNNLLMVASSGLDLMERTSDPARRERLKQAIRQSIDRGASLTQQLLAFARRSALKPEVVDLRVLVQGMRELLERSLRENILVDFRLGAAWPVEVDASQLEVAILNIAVNARDAMPGGGVITLSTRNEPGDVDRVRLSVRDTGTGMSQEVQERVFEPFFTTKEVGQGTGLGLSQVYGFIRSSGGEVHIESVLGEGTTVSLLLPRSEKAPPELAEASAAATGDGEKRARILMVEDDNNVATLVAEMLEELGNEAVRALSAADALDRLVSDGPFDLVFSDMVMPGDMDGLQLAHEIARRRPDLPVVLTTGYSSAAASAANENLRLLVKPYRIEALAAELDAALDRKPLRAAPG